MKYYRVWYEDSKGIIQQYAKGLTKAMAEYLVKTLKEEGFEAWMEEE